MHYRIYQSLRIFVHVGHYMNLTEAAYSMHMTKGAISYQIKQLEEQLGFNVFLRQHGGISFTQKGEELYHSMSILFEKIEQNIQRLTTEERNYLTVGMTTYFASRWLSPRLMRFTSKHPEIRLRIQPIMGIVDMAKEKIDLAIQWGDGGWAGVTVESLFPCPAFPTAGKKIYQQVSSKGLQFTIDNTPLLHDFDQSSSWEKWLQRAAMHIQAQSNSLVIPDPNVRVEAVKNDQGIALNDALVLPELAKKSLFQISDTRLEEFGYFLIYQNNIAKTEAFNQFRTWILEEVAEYKATENRLPEHSGKVAD